MTSVDRIYMEKQSQLYDIMYIKSYEDIGDLSDFDGWFLNYNGSFYNSNIWAGTETYAYRYRYQRYIYENYYPVARETEQARDEAYRLRINMENVRNWVFFYNPIVFFNTLSKKITGNSREDYLKFLHTAREIRDDLVNRGINEGWATDYRWFAMIQDEFFPGSWEEIFKVNDYDFDKVYEYLFSTTFPTKEGKEKFEFAMPYIRPYDQPVYSFGEIFEKILSYLVLFVVGILALWVMTYWKFMRYDVR